MMDTQHEEMRRENGPHRTLWHRHLAIQALTAVIVIIFVFWCGFQFGEIRASVGFRHGSGPGMMIRGDWGASRTYRSPEAMPAPTTAPASTATK